MLVDIQLDKSIIHEIGKFTEGCHVVSKVRISSRPE